MKYFLDTEFIEDGKTIDLISIGIVREDGLTFYAENSDCDLERANDWVKANVIPLLPGKNIYELWQIREALLAYIGEDKEPEFWGYYCSYDWVVLCQMFGRMIDLPKHFPMYINDIKSFQKVLKPQLIFPKQEKEHHALEDAKHIRLMHKLVFND